MYHSTGPIWAFSARTCSAQAPFPASPCCSLLGARYITKNVLEGDLTLAAGKILQTGLIMLLLILLQAGCAYFTDYKGHAMGAMMERDMRAELFEHCQRLSFSYYDDHSVGDLMARITGDSLSLTEFFHHCPEDIVVNLIKFVGASSSFSPFTGS